MRPSRQWIFAGLCGGLLQAMPAMGQSGGGIPRAADHPAAIAEASWYRKVAEQQRSLTNNRYDVVFIGDSLTDFWTHTGQQAWNAQIAPLKCVTAGIAGDRTEHILWRIEHLDFQRAAPKVFVLLMGTNNLGMEHPDEPADVVKAITRAVEGLLRRHPGAQVLVLEIPPSGHETGNALRQRIQAANDLLAEAALPPKATLVPLYHAFTEPSGAWKRDLTLDGTHFSSAGYAALADILVPLLRTTMNIQP